MAVTVSGKTLEATTLVMQSDLDVIVKSSRDEVFVFAENMRTGKPWPEARLLVSNGQAGVRRRHDRRRRRVQEVVQGTERRRQCARVRRGRRQRGVEHGRSQRRRRGPGPGRQGIHLHRSAGLSRRAVGPRPRRAAQSGRRRLHDRERQEVHGRSVRRPQPRRLAKRSEAFRVRQLPHQLFAAARPARWADTASWCATTTATTSPARSRSTNISWSRCSCRSTPIAKCSIAARRSKARSARSSTTARRWSAAKSAINWPAIGSYTATTDDKGEVQFKLPTREFRETQVLPLVVTLPERNLPTTQNFFLSTHRLFAGRFARCGRCLCPAKRSRQR